MAGNQPNLKVPLTVSNFDTFTAKDIEICVLFGYSSEYLVLWVILTPGNGLRRGGVHPAQQAKGTELAGGGRDNGSRD